MGIRKYGNISKAAYRKIKFFRHLRSYLVVNAFMFLLVLFTGGGFDWFPIILIWGIGIAFHYLKVFGLPGSGMFSETWEQKLIEKEEDGIEYFEDFNQPQEKVKRESWREEDIV